MTLILIYKDTMVADRMVVLREPHTFGSITRQKKLVVAKSRRFAFAVSGPTLSRGEAGILEAILEKGLTVEGSPTKHSLGHELWLSSLMIGRGASITILTKRQAYEVGKRGEDQFRLVRTSSLIPIVRGTGSVSASFCAREGVPMERIVPIVASIISSVSEEFDIVRQSDLKELRDE